MASSSAFSAPPRRVPHSGFSGMAIGVLYCFHSCLLPGCLSTLYSCPSLSFFETGGFSGLFCGFQMGLLGYFFHDSFLGCRLLHGLPSWLRADDSARCGCNPRPRPPHLAAGGLSFLGEWRRVLLGPSRFPLCCASSRSSTSAVPGVQGVRLRRMESARASSRSADDLAAENHWGAEIIGIAQGIASLSQKMSRLALSRANEFVVGEAGGSARFLYVWKRACQVGSTFQKGRKSD